MSILDIRYGEIRIKHCHMVTYFGCSLNETLSEKSMALKSTNKIN